MKRVIEIVVIFETTLTPEEAVDYLYNNLMNFVNSVSNTDIKFSSSSVHHLPKYDYEEQSIDKSKLH